MCWNTSCQTPSSADIYPFSVAKGDHISHFGNELDFFFIWHYVENIFPCH